MKTNTQLADELTAYAQDCVVQAKAAQAAARALRGKRSASLTAISTGSSNVGSAPALTNAEASVSNDKPKRTRRTKTKRGGKRTPISHEKLQLAYDLRLNGAPWKTVHEKTGTKLTPTNFRKRWEKEGIGQQTEQPAATEDNGNA